MREYYTSLAYHLGDAEAHNGMGRIYLRKGEFARSLAEFARTLEYDPRNAEALRGAAEARERLGESVCEAAAGKELVFWRYVGWWVPAALVAVAFLVTRRRQERVRGAG